MDDIFLKKTISARAGRNKIRVATYVVRMNTITKTIKWTAQAVFN